MTDFLRLALVLICAVNPAAQHRRAGGEPRTIPVAATAGVVASALALIATFAAGPILDGLDIEPETFRIAAGIVMMVTAALAMLPTGWHNDDNEPQGVLAGVVPWGWPRLANPGVIAVSLSWGADGSEAKVAGAALIAVVLGAGALLLPRNLGPLSVAVSVTLAALLIVLAVGRIVSGVRDI